VYYNDFSIVVIFLVGAFLGVGRCPVATGKLLVSPRVSLYSGLQRSSWATNSLCGSYPTPWILSRFSKCLKCWKEEAAKQEVHLQDLGHRIIFSASAAAPWLHVSRDCDPTIPYIVTPLELPL
jgi:hypothetical protein